MGGNSGKTLLKTRTRVTGKRRSKIQAVLQLENLDWLVEREVDRTVST